jgi:hypothetical protein
MKRRRSLLLLCLIAACSILIFAGIKAISRFKTAAASKDSARYRQSATFRQMIGGYYNTAGNWKSSLILNNKGGQTIVVSPVLYSLNGQRFELPTVVTSSRTPLELDLNALTRSAGPEFVSGSIQYTYVGRWMEVGAGIRIVNEEKSLIFEEQMAEPGMKFPNPELEGVFSMPFESMRVSVVMTNTTDKSLLVTGKVKFANLPLQVPISVMLAPHQGHVLKLPKGAASQARAGEVSLSHDGEKGALLAVIHAQEESKGFSLAFNFGTGLGVSNRIDGAGLRLDRLDGRNLKPVIVARNLSNETKTLSAKIPYTSTNREGFIDLPRLVLDPGEIGIFKTSSVKLRQLEFTTAGLEIEYTGTPGGVIVSAYSMSEDGDQVFVLPLKDPRGVPSSTGGYPWFIDDEKGSTIVLIKNTTNEPQRFYADVVYSGGMWGSNLRTVAPGADLFTRCKGDS